MHSPFCMPVEGTIRTLVLPKRGAQIQIPSSAEGTSLGVPLPIGFGFLICLSSAAIVELAIEGTTSHFAVLDPGSHRIISPEEHSDIIVTCDDLAVGWLEDLSALVGPK